MNITTAHTLLTAVTRLVEIAAIYQSRYSATPRLKPGSADEAWQLYQESLDTQCVIARLLEIAPREQPNRGKYGAWWLRRDVIDSGSVHALLEEAGHLLASTVYAQASARGADQCYAVHSTQANIAALLMPVSLQIASDDTLTSRQAG